MRPGPPPAFSVPTLGFPALFFLLFVAPRSDADPNLLLASFAGFALLAVAFFQFGVGIASERESPWERFVRTLPLRPGIRFAARSLSAVLFGLAHGLVEALPLLVAFAIGLAWLRERQGSTIPGMFLHATFNAVALAASILT